MLASLDRSAPISQPQQGDPPNHAGIGGWEANSPNRPYDLGVRGLEVTPLTSRARDTAETTPADLNFLPEETRRVVLRLLRTPRWRCHFTKRFTRFHVMTAMQTCFGPSAKSYGTWSPRTGLGLRDGSLTDYTRNHVGRPPSGTPRRFQRRFQNTMRLIHF